MKAEVSCHGGVTIIRLRNSNCWMASYASPDAIDYTVALDHTLVGWRIISGMNGQDTIEIIVNGDTRQVSQGARVTDLVKQLELAPERLAIELNLSILPRAKWAETEFRPGDRLEIVHFVGGG